MMYVADKDIQTYRWSPLVIIILITAALLPNKMCHLSHELFYDLVRDLRGNKRLNARIIICVKK